MTEFPPREPDPATLSTEELERRLQRKREAVRCIFRPHWPHLVPKAEAEIAAIEAEMRRRATMHLTARRPLQLDLL